MAVRKVYLAGPEVFLAEAATLGAAKCALCRRYGFEGLFPLDPAADAMPPGLAKVEAIYRLCVALLNEADLGIANLTPFRGPSADPGTIFELGVLVGRGRPVLGYTNDARDLLSRVRRLDPAAAFDAARNAWIDGEGLLIEDFGLADNLMLDACLSAGVMPIRRGRSPPERRFTDLTGFEACLDAARRHFAGAAGASVGDASTLSSLPSQARE